MVTLLGVVLRKLLLTGKPKNNKGYDMEDRIKNIEDDIEQIKGTMDRHHLENQAAQVKNTEAIEIISAKIGGLLEAWNTAAGVGKFLRWLGAIGTGVSLIYIALTGRNPP